MGSDIRSIARKYLLDQVIVSVRNKVDTPVPSGVSGAGLSSKGKKASGLPGSKARFVFVVDDRALRVVSALVPLSVLQENGVTIVERLELAREPLPDVHAIYVLSGSPQSVRALCAESAAQYRRFHVFFLDPLPESIFSQIQKADAKLVKKIATLVELNLNVLVHSTHFISLGIPGGSIPAMYGGIASVAADTAQEQSRRLLSVCVLLAAAHTWTVRIDINSSHAKLVGAKFLQARTELMKKPATGGTTSYSAGCSRYPNATLLVLDRAADLVSMLVHEFSYEAMAYDLIPLRLEHPLGVYFRLPDDENNPSSPKSKSLTTGASRASPSATDLSKRDVRFGDEDNDKVMLRVRDMHIAEGVQVVNDEFRHFLDTNAAAKMRMQMGKVSSPDGNSKSDSSAGIKELTAAVRSLPEYADLIKRHAMHVNCFEQCFAAFKSRHLDATARIEQELSTGNDGADHRIHSTTMMKALEQILSSGILDDEAKMRIVLLALAVSRGNGGGCSVPSLLYFSHFSDTYNINEMLSQCAFREQSCFRTIKGFVKVLQSYKVGTCAVSRPKSALKWRRARKEARKKVESRRKLDESIDRPPFELSRYVPPLGEIILRCVDKTLPAEMYPEIKASSNSGTEGSCAAALLPIDPAPSVLSSLTDKKPVQRADSVLLVYIAGGASLSELRTVRELGAMRPSVSIVLATDLLLPPRYFLQACAAVEDGALASRIAERPCYSPDV
ncbi:Protein ROP [Porphyridium purpureum]|uniref:Protein ROP n=1 Tax=Porphyridium purpureum TaxID=35688 RepID=A0A5J4YX82_PORPP|nr:Protein ROP [Porphyridium purpureum]|eukprot:POR8244..scf209_3